MLIARLIVHGLLAVALLGAITHQLVALLWRAGESVQPVSFVNHYRAARQQLFTRAIVTLYIVTLILGATLYPSYRVDVRVPFEEMSLGWAVGSFELKEHLAGLGLGVLPLYATLWRPRFDDSHRRDRKLVTAFVASVVWFDFLVGHVLNNIRGLG
jgi:hypothetical protein